MSTPVVVVETEAPPITIVNPPAAAPIVFVAPPGPAGPAGGAPVPVTYELVAVSSWGQAHAFPYPPDVQLVLSGERVYASAAYSDSTHVSVTFPAPFTGKVILR